MVAIVEQLKDIDAMAAEYGLYGKLISFKDGTDALGAGTYIVAGMHPIPEDAMPFMVETRIKRDSELFYPQQFAIKVDKNNIAVAIDETFEYMRDAEFVKRLYDRYEADVPYRIRQSELAGLKNWCEGIDNKDSSIEYIRRCEKGLNTFFKNEKTRQNSEKRLFFRSSRYDEEAGLRQRMKDYEKRNSSIVRLPVLMKGYGRIGKKVITGFDLKPFLKFMHECFPDVLLSVSDKEVIDYGLLGAESSRGRYVTDAEFKKTINDRFAEEGFACTNDLQPAYFEFYNVYYKEADEPFVVSAFNDVTLRFAEHSQLDELKVRGDICTAALPVDDIHQFVALAKKENMMFNIDILGQYSVPSFTEINIAYGSLDQNKMDRILSQMVEINRTKHRDHSILSERIKNAEKGICSSDNAHEYAKERYFENNL